MKDKNILRFIYDLILIILTFFMIFIYVIGLFNQGISAFKEYIFVPVAYHIYTLMCAIRILDIWIVRNNEFDN